MHFYGYANERAVGHDGKSLAVGHDGKGLAVGHESYDLKVLICVWFILLLAFRLGILAFFVQVMCWSKSSVYGIVCVL